MQYRLIPWWDLTPRCNRCRRMTAFDAPHGCRAAGGRARQTGSRFAARMKLYKTPDHKRTRGFVRFQNSPTTFPSSVRSIFSAEGTFGRPGIVMRPTAFAVPARQGVHWPHDSSAKKRITLRAATAARSLSDRTMIAAEPMKHPYGCSVSKSSGTSPRLAGSMPPEAPPGRYA